MKLNERERVIWVAGAVGAIAAGAWMLRRFLVWKSWKDLGEDNATLDKIRRYDRYSHGNGRAKRRRQQLV